MKDLIKIEEKYGKKVVSARELHGFLEVDSNFTTWCKRMIDYGFIEGQDFIPFLEESTGGRPSMDYAITIETAKHWAMMQRSEKGMQVRNYFIECEKKIQSFSLSIPQTFAEALQLAADQARFLEVKNQQILELKPKALYYDDVLSSTDAVTIYVIAKDYGISASSLNKKLNDLRIQYKQGSIWLLYSEYASMGYTKTSTTAFKHKDGTDGTSVLTKWTQRGRLSLYELLKQNCILPLIEK